MKKRIYIYEMDCYKSASEEQLQKMRIKPERYLIWKGCHLKRSLEGWKNLYGKEEKIIRMLKGWMLEKGYALSSEKISASI